MSILQKWVRVPLGGGTLLAQGRLIAPWGIRIPASNQGCFHHVLEGECWLKAKDGPSLHLQTGDFVFLSRKRGHDLGHPDRHSDMHSIDQLATEAGFTIPGSNGAFDGYSAKPGDGKDSSETATTLMTATFDRKTYLFETGLHAIPPVVHLPAESLLAAGQLQQILSLLAEEAFDLGAARALAAGNPGLPQHLMSALFVYVARAWIDSKVDAVGSGRHGLRLHDVRDEAVGKVLSRMHAEPARRWSVGSLGAVANLSRAAFSRRFVAAVGEPPLTYLTHWRMALADRTLHRTDLTVEQAALSAGYESVSASGRAYKGIIGRCPRAAHDSME